MSIQPQMPAGAPAGAEAPVNLSGAIRLSDGEALAHARAILDMARGGDHVSLVLAAQRIQCIFTEGAVAAMVAARGVIDAAFDARERGA